MILISTSSTSRPRPPPWQPAEAASWRAAVSSRFWRSEWQPKRLVLLEFPDLEAAKRFYESPEYQEAKRLREGAARFNMVAVEGLG